MIGMIDLLIADLDKEMTEAETEEKSAQTKLIADNQKQSKQRDNTNSQETSVLSNS